MKNKHLNNIKHNLVTELNDAYGFCGVADSDNVAMLNSGKGADNFVITIKDQSSIDAAELEKGKQ